MARKKKREWSTKNDCVKVLSRILKFFTIILFVWCIQQFPKVPLFSTISIINILPAFLLFSFFFLLSSPLFSVVSSASQWKQHTKQETAATTTTVSATSVHKTQQKQSWKPFNWNERLRKGKIFYFFFVNSF